MRSVTTVGTKGERHRGRERGRGGIEGNDMYTIPVMHPLTSSSTDAVVLSGASSISTMCSSRSRRWVEFTFSSVRRCTLGGRSFDIPTYCEEGEGTEKEGERGRMEGGIQREESEGGGRRKEEVVYKIMGERYIIRGR